MVKIEKLPTIKDVRRWLCTGWVRRSYYQIEGAYIVGSMARGTAGLGSDLDVAVIIRPVRGKDSLKVTEHFHQGYRANWQMPQWCGLRVDLQFYYPGELPGHYSAIALKGA